MANELAPRRAYVDAYAALQEGRQRALNEQKAIEEAQFKEASRAAAAKAMRDGRVDPTLYGNELARLGYAYAVPGAQEELFKLEEQRGKSLEAVGKGVQERQGGIDAIISTSREVLAKVNDQPGWDAWRSPLVAEFPQFDRIIPRQYSSENKSNSLMTADLLTKELQFEDIEGGIQPLNKITGQPVGDPIMKIPLDPELAAQRQKQAAAGAPKTPAEETEYSKAVGKASGERDIASFDAANAAVDAISRDYEILNILESGQPITGSAAELQLSIEKLKSAVSGRKNKAVENTELLESLLGSDVFAQISALGIGARGLDTPAEREFLRKVVAGTISLDAATLRRMAEIRINIKERAIDRFNTRVERGELDRYFERSGIPKRKIEKPERPVVERGTVATEPANAPVRVNSKAEFDRLPSGSLFIDPQGNTRRKQ